MAILQANAFFKGYCDPQSVFGNIWFIEPTYSQRWRAVCGLCWERLRGSVCCRTRGHRNWGHPKPFDKPVAIAADPTIEAIDTTIVETPQPQRWIRKRKRDKSDQYQELIEIEKNKLEYLREKSQKVENEDDDLLFLNLFCTTRGAYQKIGNYCYGSEY